MEDELRLLPLGDDEYRVLVMGREDGRLSMFVRVNKRIIRKYVQDAGEILKDLGYTGDREAFLRDIVVAWYAENCANGEVPRAVFWRTDTKIEALTKLRDAICFQRWGKTINQYPRIQQDLFPKLVVGIVKDDPIGFARGAALRALISAAYGRQDPPMVYFDQMRRYPAHAKDILNLLDTFKVSNEDMVTFDPNFYEYFTERLDAAIAVLEAKKPDAPSWESWRLDENPVWQKYIEDFDDYQAWLDSKRTIEKP